MTIGIRAARRASLASLLAPILLAACGGGGGPHSFAIDGLTPDTFVGGVTHPFTIHVPKMPSEAQASGAEILVTFTASAGTPFHGGKSASAEVAAIAIGPETISASSPIPVESFDATVSVRTAHRTSRLPDLLAHFIEHAPVAIDDFYDVIGNVPLVVGASAGVLFNDTDEDGDVLTVLSSDDVSAQGGHVTMSADGGFRYVPPVGFRGDDSFQYTCWDGAVGAIATVHLTVAAGVGGLVWFIDAAAEPGGDGTIDAPFDSIAAFMAKQGGGTMADPAAGDTVFVYAADAPYEGPLTLLDDQRLWGQGVELVIAGTLLVPAGARPILHASGPNLLALALRATVRGLDLHNDAGPAVTRSASLGGGSVHFDTVAIATVGGPAISSTAASTAYDLHLDSVDVAGSVTGGIVIRGGTGSLDVTGDTNLGIVAGATAAIDLAGSSLDATLPSVDVSSPLDAFELGGYGGRFVCTGGSATAGRHIVHALDAHGPAGDPARIEVSHCDLTAGGLAFRFGGAGAGAVTRVLEIVVDDDDLATSIGAGVKIDYDAGGPVTYVARIANDRFPAHGDVTFALSGGQVIHATVENNVSSLGTLSNVHDSVPGTCYLDVRDNAFAHIDVVAVNPGGLTGIVADSPYLMRNASDAVVWLSLKNTATCTATDFSVSPLSGYFNATGSIRTPP